MAPTEQYGFFLPSVRLAKAHWHSARQKCGLKHPATFSLVVAHMEEPLCTTTFLLLCETVLAAAGAAAHMEEPPRMIPGLNNAVSCPKSANCGCLKVTRDQNAGNVMNLSFSSPTLSFLPGEFFFSGVLSEVRDVTEVSDQRKVQCLTPPSPQSPLHYQSTKINVQF